MIAGKVSSSVCTSMTLPMALGAEFHHQLTALVVNQHGVGDGAGAVGQCLRQFALDAQFLVKGGCVDRDGIVGVDVFSCTGSKRQHQAAKCGHHHSQCTSTC